MPIYGYRCKSCNHTFEIVQAVSDEPVKNCPKCEGQVNKIFFPVGIAFKGSGFYVNDYKSPKHVTAEKSPGQSGDGKDGGNSGNGDGSGCSSCVSTGTIGSD